MQIKFDSDGKITYFLAYCDKWPEFFKKSASRMQGPAPAYSRTAGRQGSRRPATTSTIFRSVPSLEVYRVLRRRPTSETNDPFRMSLKSMMFRPAQAEMLCQVTSSRSSPLFPRNASFVAKENRATCASPTLKTLGSCPTRPRSSTLFKNSFSIIMLVF